MNAGAPDRPVVAVIVPVIRDGRLLMVRRANPPDQGRWGFPGGRVELGETLAAAAVRELREETGVAAEAVRVVDAVDAFDRSPDGTLRFHYVLVAVLCRWVAGTGVAADDALEASWMTADAILAADTSLDVHRVAVEALELSALTPPSHSIDSSSPRKRGSGSSASTGFPLSRE